MADKIEPRLDDDWGDGIAKITFILTVIGAAAFVGAVFVFIL